MAGFLDLPVEIRLQIYEYLPKSWRNMGRLYPKGKSKELYSHLRYSIDLDILYVNKKIHEEATAFLYRDWHFRIIDSQYQPCWEMLLVLPALQLLRTITITCLTSLGSTSTTSYTPRVESCLLNLCLVLPQGLNLTLIKVRLIDESIRSQLLYTGEVDLRKHSDITETLINNCQFQWRSLFAPLAHLPRGIVSKIEARFYLDFRPWAWSDQGMRIKIQKRFLDAFADCVQDVIDHRKEVGKRSRVNTHLHDGSGA